MLILLSSLVSLVLFYTTKKLLHGFSDCTLHFITLSYYTLFHVYFSNDSMKQLTKWRYSVLLLTSGAADHSFKWVVPLPVYAVIPYVICTIWTGNLKFKQKKKKQKQKNQKKTKQNKKRKKGKRSKLNGNFN